MNNIRKIIEERLENARLDFNKTTREFNAELKGQFEAYLDCLNLFPAPRTEDELIKEFEKLGYEVIVEKDHIRMSGYEDVCLYIDLKNKSYSKNKYLQAEDLTMQEHKLLNELFEVIFDDK
jgi:hypothetical protein